MEGDNVSKTQEALLEVKEKQNILEDTRNPIIE